MTELIDKQKLHEWLKVRMLKDDLNCLISKIESGDFDSKPEQNRCCITRMYEGKPCEKCPGAFTKEMVCRYASLEERVEKLEQKPEPQESEYQELLRHYPYYPFKNDNPMKAPCLSSRGYVRALCGEECKGSRCAHWGLLRDNEIDPTLRYFQSLNKPLQKKYICSNYIPCPSYKLDCDMTPCNVCPHRVEVTAHDI